MAVAWWKDTGIMAKMLSEAAEILTLGFQEIDMPKLRTNIQLSFWHIMAALLMLGIGLVTAIIAFCFEKMTANKILR